MSKQTKVLIRIFKLLTCVGFFIARKLDVDILGLIVLWGVGIMILVS